MLRLISVLQIAAILLTNMSAFAERGSHPTKSSKQVSCPGQSTSCKKARKEAESAVRDLNNYIQRMKTTVAAGTDSQKVTVEINNEYAELKERSGRLNREANRICKRIISQPNWSDSDDNDEAPTHTDLSTQVDYVQWIAPTVIAAIASFIGLGAGGVIGRFTAPAKLSASKEAEYATAQKEVAELRLEASSKDSEITVLSLETSSQNSRITELSLDTLSKNSEIASLRSDLVSENHRNTDLEDDLAKQTIMAARYESLRDKGVSLIRTTKDGEIIFLKHKAKFCAEVDGCLTKFGVEKKKFKTYAGTITPASPNDQE